MEYIIRLKNDKKASQYTDSPPGPMDQNKESEENKNQAKDTEMRD